MGVPLLIEQQLLADFVVILAQLDPDLLRHLHQMFPDAVIQSYVRWVADEFFGCSNEVNLKWQEEVKMADGQILLVNRTAKGEQVGGEFGNTGGGGFKEKELTLDVVKLPEHWQPPPIWRMEFVPVLLDYQPEERTWSVVATFFWCDGWRKMGRPKLPYIEYQSKNGGPWTVVPLEERLIGRDTNLYTHIGQRYLHIF